MVDQSDFPEKWVCDGESKNVAVEVRVPNQSRDLQRLLTTATLEESSTTDEEITVTYTGVSNFEPPVRGEVRYEVQERDGTSASRYATLDLEDASERSVSGDSVTYTIPISEVDGFSREDAVFGRQIDPAPPITDDSHTWIEIPTQDVEVWVEKGDSAQIQRTAKVRFPSEWGRDSDDTIHNSPRELLESFDPTDAAPFMLARVWMQRPSSDDWVIQHFGWVGGTGQTEDTAISKFWIYDFAELLSGVPIGATFSEPSVKTVIEEITRMTNDNTAAPVSDAVIVQPNTEAEFLQLSSNYATQGESSPLGFWFQNGGDSDAVEGDPNLLGPDGDQATGAYYSLTSDRVVEYEDVDAEERAEGEFARLPRGADENFEALTINTRSSIFQGFDWNTKSFIANHDTLLDVWEWFEQKTGAKLHFEPRAESVILVADIIPERRTFAQVEVVEYWQDTDATPEMSSSDLADAFPDFLTDALEDANVIEDEPDEYQFHAATVVEKNDALYEMNPVNTLQVRGESPHGLLDDAQDFLESAFELVGGGEPPAEKYPVAKVRVPALVQAANGVEMSPEIVESEARNLDEATTEAINELSKRLSDTTEGEIVLRGEPRIMPYDRLDAFEVCNDQVAYEQEPVTYEIESVKHRKSSDGVFKTSVRVSIWVNEDNIEVVDDETEMVEVEV